MWRHAYMYFSSAHAQTTVCPKFALLFINIKWVEPWFIHSLVLQYQISNLWSIFISRCQGYSHVIKVIQFLFIITR